jgi:hypothetical protein
MLCACASWSYTASLDSFTWIHGSSASSAQGCALESYTPSPGQLTPAALPLPRRFAASATDSLSRFWLSGGQVFDANLMTWASNEIWYFTPLSLIWTFVGGNPVGGVNPTAAGYSVWRIPSSAMSFLLDMGMEWFWTSVPIGCISWPAFRISPAGWQMYSCTTSAVTRLHGSLAAMLLARPTTTLL